MFNGSDGKVVFEITGDNSGIKSTLSDTTREIQNESKKWDAAAGDSSDNISSSLISGFKAVTASAAFIKIAKMLIDLGIESVNLASDLEEVQNVVDVTFGEKGSKEIEGWAKDASKNFGLTELQAKKYASTIGAMMKSSGMTEDEILELSTGLAGLAADMASFYNLDFDTAFEKIQSGMAGMSMPLRQLGIDMTEGAIAAWAVAQGYEKAFGKMSQEEQMLVRYRYLMAVTADAQGDFVRTADSFANSKRRMETGFETLKAQLGELLLPIATDITNAVAGLLEILTAPPEETVFDKAEDSMSDAVQQATQAQGILGYMDKLYEKYGDAATKSEEWKKALEELKKVMPEVNQFISDETGALTLSNEQLREYVENTKQAAIEDAKRKAISDLTDQYTEASMNYYTAEVNRDIAQAQADEAVKQIVDYIVKGHTARAEAMGDEYDPESSGLYTNADELFTMFQNGQISMRELMFEAEGVANEIGDSQSTLKALEQVYNDQMKAVTNNANEMGTLQTKIQELEFELSIAETALQRMAEAAALNAGGDGVEGSHALGLDRVPHDDYIASLHKGEAVLTSEEAALWRSARYGAVSAGLSIDYDRLGGSMRDNIHAGGNVYLNGQIVGRVVSQEQAQSFRNLTRSGWQS